MRSVPVVVSLASGGRGLDVPQLLVLSEGVVDGHAQRGGKTVETDDVEVADDFDGHVDVDIRILVVFLTVVLIHAVLVVVFQRGAIVVVRELMVVWKGAHWDGKGGRGSISRGWWKVEVIVR